MDSVRRQRLMDAGIDVDSALGRFMNNEALLERFLAKFPADPNHDRLTAAIAAGDAMEIAQTDEKFHEIIYSGTGNQKLMQILSNLREQMYRYRLEYIKDANKRQILLVEHEQILKALSLRHVKEARLAVREHIDNQEITVLKNLKEQEENDVQRKVSGRRNRVRGD